jgi:uncharacterized membrane protein (UPF0127 family)
LGWLCNKSFFLSLLFFPAAFSQARTYLEFSKATGHLHGQAITPLYLALNQEDRELGLMNVTKLGADEGVLFVFEESAPRAFWMKNTFIPLSIGFFDERGCLQEFFDMEPVASVLQTEIPQYRSKGDSQFALEMGKGWFKKHRLHPGQALQVKLSSGQDSGLSPEAKKILKRLDGSAKCPPIKALQGT